MLIFEYRCGQCSSVFEQFLALKQEWQLACVSCESDDISRIDGSYFYPNKTFCPHDKKLDQNELPNQLAGIMGDQSLSCAGCGVDGAAGSCGSKGKKKGGGCGSGGCGGCKSSCS